MLSTQVDISLEQYRADSMQQMLKVHQLLLFYCNRVAKSYLLKLIGQGNWPLEDKQVPYTLSCHIVQVTQVLPGQRSAAGASGSCLHASGMWRSRTPHSLFPGRGPAQVLASLPPELLTSTQNLTFYPLPYGFRPTFRSSRMRRGILLEGQEHGLQHA